MRNPSNPGPWKKASSWWEEILQESLLHKNRRFWGTIWRSVAALLGWIIGQAIIALVFIMRHVFIKMFHSKDAVVATIYASCMASLITWAMLRVTSLTFTYEISTDHPLITAPDPVACLKVWDIGPYAPENDHESSIKKFLREMGYIETPADAERYIDKFSVKGKKSPITGDMVFESALEYKVDPRLMLAIMRKDSNFATAGLAVNSHNPGNVHTYGGKVKDWETWENGVDAVAWWLDCHRFDKKRQSAASPEGLAFRFLYFKINLF